MSEYSTVWTGSYPNLCCGEWELYKDGELLDVDIPFQGEQAYTFGEYSTWYFDENWIEQWDFYEDGTHCEEWVEQYKDWLCSFAPERDFSKIYHAFQLNDWRYSSCGGCI